MIEAGTIIVAGPRESVQDLAETLEYAVDELYLVGDASKVRSVYNAIHEGYKLGVRL
jgi:2,4-dienoyl-CoA reductase (NADPH2)